MKYFTTILTLIFFASSHFPNGVIHAQNVSFEGTSITLEKGETRHVVQVLCDPTVDEVRSAFDEYMDDYHDIKMNTGNLFGKHRIIEGEEIRLPAVSPKLMNLYARIIESGDQSELSVFGSFGPEMYITAESFPEEHQNLKNLVLEFTTTFLPKYFQEAILDQRDRISDLRDDISDIDSEIGRNERKIINLEDENVELDQEKESIRGEILKEEKSLKLIKERRSAINSQMVEIVDKSK